MRLFFIVFFSIYGLLHFYAFLKAKAALSFSTATSIAVLAFMVLLTGSPYFVHQSEGAGLELLARGISLVGYLWMGALFIFVSASFVIDIYRLIIRLTGFVLSVDFAALIPSARLSFFLPLILSFAVNSYGLFEAKDIRIEHVTVKTSKLPKEASPIKIVQISDVHLGLIVRHSRLEKIIEAVQEVDPDILVSTGDLVDGQINNLEGLAEIFQQVNPRYGKYAVTGNHEYYAGLDQSLEFTRAAGFTLLRGSAAMAGTINLVGVDDISGHRYGLFINVHEKELLNSIDRGKFTVLLKHRPNISNEALGLFDLQLSGHTHKGQIFPFNLLSKLMFPYDAGYFNLQDNSNLYVNRGAGTWGPPVRFLSPPEVTVVELVHES